MLEPEKPGRCVAPALRNQAWATGEETQRWVQGGGDKPPPTKTQLVNEPLVPCAVSVQVPLKRYGPFPVVGGCEVFTVPVHDELPAVPLYVVPLTSAPDIVPVPPPPLVLVKLPETLPLVSAVTVHVPLHSPEHPLQLPE